MTSVQNQVPIHKATSHRLRIVSHPSLFCKKLRRLTIGNSFSIVEFYRDTKNMKFHNVIYLLMYALCVALGHILQKSVLNGGVDRYVFAFIRILTGFLFIFSLILVKKYSPIQILKKNTWHFIVLGVFFSGFGILLKLWGLSHTTATNAAFIMSLSFITVIFFAFFMLKEQAPKRFYGLVILMIGGVYLVTTGGRRLLPQKGDLIILGLIFLIGFMRVYGKKVLEKLSVLETAFGRSFFGMIFLGALIPIFAPSGFSTITSMKLLLLILANGITFSGSILSFYKALQSEGASNSGMFSLLVPVMTAIMGGFFLRERMSLVQMIGGAIIIGGSFFIARIKIKQANF